MMTSPRCGTPGRELGSSSPIAACQMLYARAERVFLVVSSIRRMWPHCMAAEFRRLQSNCGHTCAAVARPRRVTRRHASEGDVMRR
jgi:hypothetical protein